MSNRYTHAPDERRANEPGRMAGLASGFIIAAALIAGPSLAQMQGNPMQGHMRGDFDGDGKLTQKEYSTFQMAAIMAADADGDGAVSNNEFQLRWGQVRERLVGDPIDGEAEGRVTALLWRRLDPDRSGEIGPMEVDSLAIDRFERADLDKDGFIDRGEVTALRDKLARSAAVRR